MIASSQADRMLADLLLGSRLVSHSGGAIAYVPAPAADRRPDKEA
ncbi:hypothetical protein [Streptomyces yerevanensis]|nr:hypothetical protein [Streptomyces yerevanensis]